MIRPLAATEPPALVRSLSRADIMWNRPIFRAPPLRVEPPVFDLSVLYYEGVPLNRSGK